MSTTKTILLQTSIYGVGQAMRGLSSLILLPIYTHHLAPAEYGLVELIMVVIELTGLVFGVRIVAGVFRYYTDADSVEGKRRVISSTLNLLMAASIVGISVLFVASTHISELLGAREDFSNALRTLSLVLVCTAINETFFAYLRIEDRPTAYVTLNLLKFVTQLLLSIVLIVYWNFGYWGIIWASLLSSALLTLLFCAWLWPAIGFAMDKQWAIKLLRFSAPIVVASLGMYYMTISNRLFLNAYAGFAAVGIFALAYKFGLTYHSLVWGPFATHWNAKQFSYARSANAEELFGHIFFYVNFALIVGAVGVIVLAPHFLRLFTAAEFWPAIEVVPWVVASSVLLCWSDFFRFGIMRAAETQHIAYATLGTMAIVTALYMLWVPTDGAVGAAQAMFVAFGFRFGYIFFVSQRLFEIQVPWRRLAATLGLLMALGYFLQHWHLADGSALIAKGGAVLTCAALLFLTPAIPREHRALMFSTIVRFTSPGSRKEQESK